MTGRRVSLTIVAVALLVALVVVPVAAGRTITTTGANVFVGEEDLSFTAIPANETVVWWVHYLDDSPGGNWYSLPLRATNGVITELNRDIPVGLYYVFTNAVETNLSDRTTARGYINVQTPEVKLDVVLSNSRLDSVNGKSVTHDNTLDFELMNNLNGLPNGVMNIEVTLPGGGVTTQFGGLSLSGIPVDGSTQYRGAINLINVEAGTYTAQAKWPRASDFYGKGFDSNSVTFEVIAPKAIPATGCLYISSTPLGASIYVDGIYKGVTPLEISELSEGSHQVKITRSGYYDHTQTASVTVGKTTTVSAALSPIPPTPTPTPAPVSGVGSYTSISSGSLDVRSTPSAASIYIDGVYKGVTPNVVPGLSAGSHQVRILRSGYDDYTLITTVTAGKTNAISATLTPISTAYSTTSDVASVVLTESSLSTQQQNLNDLKADIDARAADGVDVSAAQAKYDAASKALTSAASAAPSKAAEYIASAIKNMDEAKLLLDKAWAEKEVADTGAALESLDSRITYFVESRSMGSDPQVVAIMTKRESAVQFYTQAQDYLNAENYQMARSKATDGLNKANEALDEANALREEIGEGSNFDNILLYAGIGVVGLLILIAIVLRAKHLIHSRQNRRKKTQNGGAGAGEARPSGSPVGHNTGKTPRHRGTIIPPSAKPVGLSKADVSDRKKGRSSSDVILSDGGTTESTAKPDLTITLSHTAIHADEWDKIGLTLVNTGTAPAFDITLTFSNDVDTRLLRPVDLAAGESITIDAGIKPRTKGKIPLEITARYRDAGNRTYKQITSCWLLVVSQNDSPGSPLPSSIPHPMTPKSLPPEMAERYIASEYLGRGGFARVFKVQKPDGSWAALKIPISLDAATGKSFIAELQNWTSMVHENIVRVQDYNIMPLPYFEMELCDGTLAELEKPVPPDHAAWLLFNVCEGLKYAHAHGILHRDLKPQNIMLRDGVPKITDWGLSRVMTQSRTTTVSGGFTAYYAAPEQITNKPKDQRTDIWQLGVILYELVTGQLPFTGESMVEIGIAIATKTPERPGAVHPGAQPLDAIILKCLEKDPEQRYQSVADLQKDLAAYLKMNYIESLKGSIQANDLHRSAYYCGDLVLISMKTGNLVDAYKYAADLARYSAGEARAQVIELAKQIKMRVEMGAQELPDELIRKAEVIVHQVRMR